MTSKRQAGWVLQAQLGDREALEALLRDAHPKLHLYLAGLVGPQDAEDVLQDVFLIICRGLAGLRCPELFLPWSYRIASREAFRLLKKQKQRPEWSGEEILPENEPAAPAWEPPRELLEDWPEMQALPPASRVVLGLHFGQQLSLPEAAAVLEIPLGTVKSRLAAGLARLRNRIGKERRL